jgi:transposase
MSTKELRRVEILGRVKAKTLRLTDAATLLGLSYRQAKRVWRRFRRHGAPGVRHRSAGRPSNRQVASATRRRALALIRAKYSGSVATRFGPTLAAEHLASEDGLQVDHETLRRWMVEAGLWRRMRRARPHRQRRERKAHFGELVQLDGSFHAWYEDRGPQRCLLSMVDDATSTTLGVIGGEESIWAAVGVLRRWIEQYGVPLALYTDWKNVYVRAATEAELATGAVPLTQFGRMCAALGIRILAASSPQAKGRIERNHGTHQDRLVKKLRRLDLADDTPVNAYLTASYWPAHNARFTQAPAAPEDFHRRGPSARELDRIFHLEQSRVVGADWVVRYQNRLLQLQRQSGQAPARSTVTVREAQDGQLSIEYRGHAVRWQEITATVAPRGHAGAPRPTPPPPAAPRPRRPSAAHPWRQSYTNVRPHQTLWQAMKS